VSREDEHREDELPTRTDADAPAHATPTRTDADLSETGNARRLINAHGKDLRYVPPWKRWLVYDGTRWAQDDTGEVMRRTATVVRMLDEELERENDDGRRKALRKWATASESARVRANTVTLAQSELKVVARPEDFDRDPFLLNVANGTIDLRTSKLQHHRREDMITKLAPVRHELAATCPRWQAFLERVLPPPALRAFFQRAIGYSITADTTEHSIFVPHGNGANGKTTALDTISRMLGDYAKTAEATAFLVKDHDSVRNDLAALVGARLGACSETEDGRRMGVALVKQLTGGDPLSVRFLYAEFFELRPTFKPWLATNYRPVIRGSDEGIWRRVKLIPFTVTIPEDERDPRLGEKLRAELPGILQWAVEGCRAWLASGLQPSEEVRTATQAYRDDMDPLRQWLTESCVLEEGARGAVTDLYESYAAWAKANVDEPLSKRAWGSRLDERGISSKKGAKGGRVRIGIRLGGASQGGIDTAPPRVDLIDPPSPTGGRREAQRGAHPGNFPHVFPIGDFPEAAPQTPPGGLAPPITGQPSREPGADDEDHPIAQGAT